MYFDLAGSVKVKGTCPRQGGDDNQGGSAVGLMFFLNMAHPQSDVQNGETDASQTAEQMGHEVGMLGCAQKTQQGQPPGQRQPGLFALIAQVAPAFALELKGRQKAQCAENGS